MPTAPKLAQPRKAKVHRMKWQVLVPTLMLGFGALLLFLGLWFAAGYGMALADPAFRARLEASRGRPIQNLGKKTRLAICYIVLGLALLVAGGLWQ